MGKGILKMCLLLMAVVGVNQPSGQNGVSPEDDTEIAQRMKEREVTLRQHQQLLEKEIAELEARQESLAWPLWELEKKMEWHTCTVFGLLVPALLVIWMQHRNEARRGHREEETGLGSLGKVCKGVAFLANPLVLLRAIGIFMDATVGCFPFFADGLVEISLELFRTRKKNLVLEIP